MSVVPFSNCVITNKWSFKFKAAIHVFEQSPCIYCSRSILNDRKCLRNTATSEAVNSGIAVAPLKYSAASFFLEAVGITDHVISLPKRIFMCKSLFIKTVLISDVAFFSPSFLRKRNWELRKKMLWLSEHGIFKSDSCLWDFRLRKCALKVGCRCPIPLQRTGTRLPFRVSSNSNDSVILCRLHHCCRAPLAVSFYSLRLLRMSRKSNVFLLGFK